MLPLDTSDEAQRVQLEVYRRMSPSRCAELGLEMRDDSRAGGDRGATFRVEGRWTSGVDCGAASSVGTRDHVASRLAQVTAEPLRAALG
jgi:hypothetical protein